MMSTPNSKTTISWATPQPSEDVADEEEEEEEEEKALLRKNVEDIVTALADKKQRDLETMRQYLKSNSTAHFKLNTNVTMRKEDPAKEKTNGQVASSPIHNLKRGSPTEFVGATVKTKSLRPSTPQKSIRQSWTAFDMLRCTLLDLPVATLFFVTVLAYGVRHVHDDYFVPLLHQIRRTDEQLTEEYTYYERTCTAMDVTTQDITDLVVTNTSTTSETVDQMMTHGALLIPQVLPPDIVRDLRRYVVDRNSHLSASEVLPVSQGDNRRSFAFDATESEIVTRAVEHVAHNRILKPLVEQLVGDSDPAVTEITAITAFFGCIDQVWHPDVKQDGSAAKFARTYSHSYSLFIPLQDTTHAMGATDICPGTHYCSNDLINVCEANKLSLSQSSGTNVWKAGDAALLNQQVWHRGAKHQDQHALPRVVFIMSFMARPSVDDPRQFSRGTFFHMKWNMWGHTWRDLMDAHYSMIKPFSILRSLGLWKPSKDRHWGYDFITASLFRIANNQLGMQAEDLVLFVHNVMDKIHYPRWLQGPLPIDDNDPDAWQVYIRETINNTVRLLRVCTAVALGLYVSVSFVLARLTNRTTFTGMRNRLLLMCGVILMGAMFSWERLQKSNLAVHVKHGRLFHLPFPSVMLEQFGNDTFIGPTTLPNRADVLVGSRYDAAYLGAYNRWLDFHPGNVDFQILVSANAQFYQSYHGLPLAFREHVLSNVMRRVTGRSDRFLEQEPVTGAWMEMPYERARKYIHMELATHNTSRRRRIMLQTFRSLSACYRFGRLRGTKMARMTVSNLNRLQERLFPIAPPLESHPIATNQGGLLSPYFTVRRNAKLSYRAMRNNSNFRGLRHFNLERVAQPDIDRNRWAGDVVMCNFEGRGIYLYGSIAKVLSEGAFDIAYPDGDVEYNVEPSRLSKYIPVKVSDTVSVSGQGDDEWHDGVVSRVMPNGEIDVVYNNGVKEFRIWPQHYRINW